MRVFLLILGLLVALVVAAFLALVSGNLELSAAKVGAVFAHKLLGAGEVQRSSVVIVWDLRLVRILMAILAGVALAGAGAIYQAIFRNPLVEPFILGASSGASFGASLAIVVGFLPLGLSAFGFGLLAVFLAYFLAFQKERTNSVALVLSGVIVGSIFSALVGIMKYFSDDSELREITFWMMGGFYHSSWGDVGLNLSFGLPCFLLAWLLGWKLNVLSLGDEEARGLGVNPQIYKAIFIILATLMCALCVASVGIIAWVGLMMPHAARLIVGADNRAVLPVAGLLGAIYMLACDTLARTLSSGEIPVGIIVSLVGAPFLLWILRAKSARVFG